MSTVRDIVSVPEAALVAILGTAGGHHIHALAHNHDVRTVTVGRRRRSMGAQHALGRGTKSRDDVDAILGELVDRVMRRLRKAGRTGRTVTLRLRFDDFTRATRGHTLDQATAHTPTILAIGRGLLATAWPTIERRGITLIGISVANLDDDGGAQLALPFARDGDSSLDTALDDVRDRFGSAAVMRASLVDREPGLSVPLLPD